MSINLHRFRYEPIDDLHGKVFIDDKKISCNSFDVRFRVDEVPSVKINLLGNSVIDAMAAIEFSDENLLEAVRNRIHDGEFLKSLMWMINDEYRIDRNRKRESSYTDDGPDGDRDKI